MDDFTTLRRQADDAMRKGDFQAANRLYCAAWDHYGDQRVAASEAGTVREFDKQHPAEEAFWLLLSGANAQFHVGDFEGCLDTGVTAFELFKDLGFVVGNPFFHLRVGQASFELEEPDEHDEKGTAIDNLARALICGGIEIFSGETPKYLEAVTAVLKPPEDFSSWHEAKNVGCCLSNLNGASGYLAEVFTEKYGSPPPYESP